MQLADAVGVAGQLDGQHRHAEVLLLVAGILASQAEELVTGKAELFVVLAEELLQQFGGEMVDAGLHRCVRGEDVAGADDLAGLGEGDVALVHQQADALQRQEGGMPFVHVADIGDDPQGAQGADAADAQQDLLDHAHLLVADVELGGDQAVLGRVGLQVGVQQVERHPADLDAPDMDPEFPAAELQLDLQRADRFRHAPGSAAGCRSRSRDSIPAATRRC